MTVILASVAFWAPVTFTRVGDDGQVEKISFRARFKRLKKTERINLEHRIAATSMLPETRKLLQDIVDDSTTADQRRDFLKARLAAVPTSNTEILKEILADWDLKGHKGEIVPYTQAVLAEAEEALDGLEGAIVGAWQDALANAASPEVQAKNSAAQSATTS